MVSSCHAKFLVNSAQRSTCSEQGDYITRHVVTSKKFKNVRLKSGGDRLGEVVVLRAVLIIVKGMYPGVIS